MTDTAQVHPAKAAMSEAFAILSATTNDEIFADQIALVCAGICGDGPVDPAKLVEGFSRGCQQLRFEFGKLSRGWSRKELRAMPRINTFTDRQLVQAICIDEPQLAVTLISAIVAIGAMLRDENPPDLPKMVARIIVTGHTQHSILLAMPITQRIPAMVEYVADFEHGTQFLSKLIDDFERVAKNGSDDAKSAIAILGFIQTFRVFHIGRHVVSMKKLNSGLL